MAVGNLNASRFHPIAFFHKRLNFHHEFNRLTPYSMDNGLKPLLTTNFQWTFLLLAAKEDLLLVIIVGLIMSFV